LEVLQHFVRLQNFRGLAPVQAMRNFLLLFRLPGEAQKIDRIIEHFASQYCQQNPGLFDHPGSPKSRVYNAQTYHMFIPWPRHVLYTLLRHNYAEHLVVQSQCEGAHESRGFYAHNRFFECFPATGHGWLSEIKYWIIYFLTQEIFNSIKSESFKFPDDEVGNGIHSLNLNTAVFKLADKQGWLQKQGS
jgi:hypothetical protein